MKALFSLPLSLLLPLVPLPALAEDKCKEEISWEESGEVIICPLTRWGWGTVPGIPWTVPEDVLLVIFPPQPELHFSGDQEGGVNLAQAMLVLPSLQLGGWAAVTPVLALKGQDDGTRQGQSVVIEGGVIMSLGDIMQLKISGERTIHPFPDTSLQVSGSFHF